ncbi:MAG: hypothetical protein HQL30_07100 [Candidatus Omnitrophica bacterium]|nr:hypothetical protein [Candidatus Omnitrophota bacterium]
MSDSTVKLCKGGDNCHEANHLCKIVVSGDMGRVKEIVKGAEYYCLNCGRAARSKENLCKPSKI